MEPAINLSARSLQYYIIDRHWESGLEFFRIETAFLHRLLEDHFVRLTGEKYFGNLKTTGKKLGKLEMDENRVSKLLYEQLTQLEFIAEDIIPENAEELAAKQVQLEYGVTTLTHEYREVKKEMFALIKSVMKEHNARTA
jgi:hypothetical protein